MSAAAVGRNRGTEEGKEAQVICQRQCGACPLAAHSLCALRSESCKFHCPRCTQQKRLRSQTNLQAETPAQITTQYQSHIIILVGVADCTRKIRFLSSWVMKVYNPRFCYSGWKIREEGSISICLFSPPKRSLPIPPLLSLPLSLKRLIGAPHSSFSLSLFNNGPLWRNASSRIIHEGRREGGREGDCII